MQHSSTALPESSLSQRVEILFSKQPLLFCLFLGDPPLQQGTQAACQAKNVLHLPLGPLKPVSVFPVDFGLGPTASRQHNAFAVHLGSFWQGEIQHNPATAKQSPDAT